MADIDTNQGQVPLYVPPQPGTDTDGTADGASTVTTNNGGTGTIVTEDGTVVTDTVVSYADDGSVVLNDGEPVDEYITDSSIPVLQEPVDPETLVVQGGNVGGNDNDVDDDDTALDSGDSDEGTTVNEEEDSLVTDQELPDTSNQHQGEGDTDGGETNSQNTTLESQDHVPGDESHAPGDESHAPGDESHAPGDESHAPGDESHAPGDESHAPGDESHVPGDESHAPGDESHAPGDESHVPGDESHVLGDESHVPGDESHVPGDESHVPEGQGGVPAGGGGGTNFGDDLAETATDILTITVEGADSDDALVDSGDEGTEETGDGDSEVLTDADGKPITDLATEGGGQGGQGGQGGNGGDTGGGGDTAVVDVTDTPPPPPPIPPSDGETTTVEGGVAVGGGAAVGGGTAVSGAVIYGDENYQNGILLNNLEGTINSITDIYNEAQALAESLPDGDLKTSFLDFLAKVGATLLMLSDMLYDLQRINVEQSRNSTEAQKDAAIYGINERQKAEHKRLKAEAKKRKKAKMGVMGKILLVFKMVFLAVAAAIVQIIPGLGQLAAAYMVAEMADTAAQLGGKQINCVQGLTNGIATAVVASMPYLSDSQKDQCRTAIKAICATVILATMFLSPLAFTLGGGDLIRATLLDSGLITNEDLKNKLGMALTVCQAVAQVVMAIVLFIIPGGQEAGVALIASAVGKTAAEVSEIVIKILNVVMSIVTVTTEVNQALIASLTMEIAKIKGDYESDQALIEMLIEMIKQCIKTLQDGISGYMSQISAVSSTLLKNFSDLSASLGQLYTAM